MITHDNPCISIVIVNYHSEDLLLDCLCSINHSVDVEVIVANNGSHPAKQTALLALYPRVTWIDLASNIGFGAACNEGARLASTETLLFLNPDSTVFPETPALLSRILEEPRYANAIVGCRILNSDGSVQLSCRSFPRLTGFLSHRYSLMTKFFPNNPLSRQYLRSDLDHTSDATVDWVSGAAVAMKRSVFQRLGGFSKLFFLYFEDVDLCKRAKSLGIPTHFCGNVIVVHQIGGSSASSTKALFYRHASMWKYYKLYLKVPVLDPLVFAAIAARFVLQAAVTITRRLKKATGGQLSVSKLAPYGVPLPSPGLARMVVQEPKEKRLDLAE